MIGAISTRSSFGNNGLSLSGPAVLPGFRLFNSLSMPFTDMSMTDNMAMVRHSMMVCLQGSKMMASFLIHSL